MSRTPLLLFGTAVLLTGAAAQAQTASALLREFEPLAGAPAGHYFAGAHFVDANSSGGFAAKITSVDGTTQLDHVWGSPDGNAAGLLRTESTLGPLVQTAFERYLGIAQDGRLCYSAVGTGGPVGDFDSAWIDATPIAVQGDPHPTLPGKFWITLTQTGITSHGQPYLRGGIAGVPGGLVQRRGLFYGSPLSPLLLGGDLVPGLPEPLSAKQAVAIDFSVSSLGSRYLAQVRMDGPSVDLASDDALVLDGSGLVLGGSRVQEGVPIPTSVGGDGSEAWDSFGATGITDSGAWFFTGRSDASSATDEILVYDGQIRFREGDTIDGRVVTGEILAASMNALGQIAYVWDVEDGLGGSLEALFFEDRLMLLEGQLVDWNGDGLVDPGFTFSFFNSGWPSLALGRRGADDVLYFSATVNTGGQGGYWTLMELVFPSTATTFCAGDGSGAPCPCGNLAGAGQGCQNSSGQGALLAPSGTPDTTSDTLVLRSSQAPPSKPGIFFQGDVALTGSTPLGDGQLCAGGNVLRLEVVFSDAAGSATSSVPISLAGGVSPGDLRFYQYWFRDSAGPCAIGFNTTNGLAVQW